MSDKQRADSSSERTERQNLTLYLGAAVVLGGVAAYVLGGKFLLRDMRGLSKEATRVMHEIRPVPATRVNTVRVDAEDFQPLAQAKQPKAAASASSAAPLMGDRLSRRVADSMEGAAAARVRDTDPGNETFPPSKGGRTPPAASDDEDEDDFGEWSKTKSNSKSSGPDSAAKLAAARAEEGTAPRTLR